MAEASPHAQCLACAFPFWEQLTPAEQERLCRFTRPVHYAKGARVHSPLESCVGILLPVSSTHLTLPTRSDV